MICFHSSFQFKDSVGFVASSVESVWTLLEFRVPFLSWLFVAFLSIASIILYLIPLRLESVTTLCHLKKEIIKEEEEDIYYYSHLVGP